MIHSPVFALSLYALAVAVSALILRMAPAAVQPSFQGSTGRHTAIDGLRGLLAYGVFIHHGVITWQYLHTGTWALPPSQLHVHLGQSSVALFFMVTSFLFWNKVLTAGRRMDWREFVVSRLYRVYPVYAVTVAASLMLVMVSTDFSVTGDVFGWVRALTGWATFKTPAINGMENAGQIVAYATWSLPYELLFYSLLPALAFLVPSARQSRPALLSLGMVLVVVWYYGRFSPAVLECFLGGFIAAYGVRRPGLVRLARSKLGLIVALAALTGTVAGFKSAYSPIPVLGLSVFFLAVAAGQDFGGLLTRRPVVWMGDVSYGVYLLHGLVLWTLFTANAPLRAAVLGNEPLFAVLLAGAGVVVIGLASLVHVAIERPAVARGRTRRIRTQDADLSRVPV